MSAAVDMGIFQGIQFSCDGPTISHMLFADDSLFFLRANVQNCQNFVQILDIYYMTSRQVVNYDKFSLFLSANSPSFMAHDIGCALRVHVTLNSGIYLGLPSLGGGLKD